MAEEEVSNDASKQVLGRVKTRMAGNSAFRNSLAATLARYGNGMAHQPLNMYTVNQIRRYIWKI